MKDFTAFELIEIETIFGGKLRPTYIGINGDLYDTNTGSMIFFED